MKYENQNSHKKSSRFDTNEIWQDNPQQNNDKLPLDLRQVKKDAELKHASSVPVVGSRSSLQRKIIFDDVPDDNNCKIPRLPLMAPSNQLFKYSSSQIPITPMAVTNKVLNSSSFSGISASCDSVPLSPVDHNGSCGKEFRTLAPEYGKDDVAGSSIVRVQNSQVCMIC